MGVMGSGTAIDWNGNLANLLLLLVAGWLCCCGLMLFLRRKHLSREWSDPVFRVPILVFESDDWGPGPESDAEALSEIATAMTRFADEEGRHPVVTLGVVLGLPDGEWIAENGFTQYRSIALTDPRHAAIREEMRRGAEKGVFVLQLHGGEHYWPAAVLARAREDVGIRAWVAQGPRARTESLPPELQTRWVDCALLPSRPIADSEIPPAVAKETEAFSQTFGFPPKVVVPPAFVWTESVERAWRAHGLEILVTPGCTLTGRDSKGKLIEANLTWNGQRSASGMTYVVRDVYFEPRRGHRAQGLVEAMVAKSRCGRPTMVETHRDNFTGSAQLRLLSITEMEQAVEQCQARYPSLRFMSTQELVGILAARSPRFIDERMLARISVFIERLRVNPALRKYWLLSGLALISWLGALASRSLRPAGTGP